MTTIAARPVSQTRAMVIAFVLPVAAVLIGVLAGALISSGKGMAVVGLGALFIPVLVIRRPYLTPAVLLFSALLIEQFPDPLGHTVSNLTGHIPLFHGLGAVHLSPADLVLGGACVLAWAKRRERHESLAIRSPVAWAVVAVLGAVVLGLAVGMAHHGQTRMSFMEVRPYVYLACCYFVSSSLLTNRKALRALLWAVVIDGTIKGVQALVVFMSVRHMVPRPDAVLGHEEALFFGIFVFVVASLWVFDVKGRLRTWGTWALPLVLAGDLANSRRTAWLVLGGGLIVLAAIAYKCMPSRRVIVTRLVAFTCIALAVYMPLFWNKSGGLAQPARAIRSIVAPSTRDASSDLYRVQEDANLRVNIRTGGMLGRGFGVPIDYPLEITDISSIDPYIAYVPHDGILYILMRMGLLGGIAIWGLIGTGIISGCKTARFIARDRELAAVGGVIACTLVGYTLEAAVDQGFFMYRVAFVVGTLLGVLGAVSRLQPSREARQSRPSAGEMRVAA